MTESPVTGGAGAGATPEPQPSQPAQRPDRQFQPRKPRRDDRFLVTLDALDDKGRCTGRLRRVEGEYLVRLRNAVPGDRVRGRVLRRRRDVVDADVVELRERSPDRVAPACPHVASCGGCSFQELAYAAQLAELHRVLRDTLAPLLGGSAGVEVEPVIPCADPWHYRNKMDFTFGSRRYVEPDEPEGVESGFALGLHARGRWNKVLDVRECAIAFRGANAILATARELARRRGLTPWDVRTHTGLLRHLVLRRSWTSGEILVSLVTSEEASELVEPFAADLWAAHPELTTLVQNVRSGPALVAVGESERVIHGRGRIRESLAGIDFEISANSFFQTNTPQARRLVEIVLEAADCGSSTRVADLYCGAGTFTLPLARRAASVRGFELSPQAVADGERNAQENGVTNVQLVAGDLAETVAGLASDDEGAPDVCVLDPPRAGLHPRVATAVLKVAPRRIVHVSCNPRAAVDDLGGFLRAGYELRRIRPIDLFPHTPHLECVFELERRADA